LNLLPFTLRTLQWRVRRVYPETPLHLVVRRVCPEVFAVLGAHPKKSPSGFSRPFDRFALSGQAGDRPPLQLILTVDATKANFFSRLQPLSSFSLCRAAAEDPQRSLQIN